MSLNFPPVTTHERDVDLLVNILASLIEDHAGVYVSTPITSGRRFAEWSNSRDVEIDLSHPETYQDFLREVLEPNSEHAKCVIKKLRGIFSKALIDPTALKDIDGWNQDDYRYLWARVIEKYADTVVFLNGWQYSNGCAYEFLTANGMAHRPSILKETLEPLTLVEGIRLLKAAVIDLNRSKLATDFLQQVLNQLNKLHTPEEALAEA